MTSLKDRIERLFTRTYLWSFPGSVGLEYGLEMWRMRILFTICFIGVFFGFIALIPSVWLAIAEDRWEVAAVDVSIYLWLLAVMLARRRSLAARAWAASAALFVLGVALSFALGPYGAGYVWIFSFAVLSGVLIGMRAAIYALLLNAAAVLLVALAIAAGLLPWAAEFDNALEKWLVTAASLLLLNTLVALSTALMLRGLRETIEQEHLARKNLETERFKLFRSNEQLLKEIAVRQETETALRRSELLFRELIEHSAVPSVVFGMDGAVEFVNLAFSHSFGWSLEEVQSLDVFSRLVMPAPECRMEVLDSLVSNGKREIEIEEGSLNCKMGKRKEVVFHANCLPDGRNHIQIIDMTDRNLADREKSKLEEQLRQAQKMEAIGNLAGGIAHDFNNILTIILGISQMLLKDLEESDPLYHQIEEIEEAGERGAAMTRQLLVFSRKQVVRPEVLNLNNVIEGIDKMLHRILREDIELHIELEEALGPVEADPGQIDQVILNLAANSRDAMPRGGVFTVKTYNAELGPDYFQERGLPAAPGSYVVLSMSDTGVGMDKDTLSRIYEPFFTTKDRDKGTGLGLATVYGIVKQAGGHIFVYSEPGLGTTFRIYLPRVEKDYREPTKTQKAERKGSETILVVEDDEAVRRLAVKSLTRFGYTVLDAHNGEEAVETLAGHEGTIHLVLTDVVMPKMGGRELAEKAKEIRPGLKVVFMSGYIDDTVFRQGIIEKGANFIEKPFSPTELADKVREVLDREEV